jgi:hypothetical protein
VQQVDAEIKAGTFFTNLQEEDPQKEKIFFISTPFFLFVSRVLEP